GGAPVLRAVVGVRSAGRRAVVEHAVEVGFLVVLERLPHLAPGAAAFALEEADVGLRVERARLLARRPDLLDPRSADALVARRPALAAVGALVDAGAAAGRGAAHSRA